MTEPARVDSEAELDAAREALIPRIRKCDLPAFKEFLELSGGKIEWIDWTEPPH